jgi:hypothetical protein
MNQVLTGISIIEVGLMNQAPTKILLKAGMMNQAPNNILLKVGLMNQGLPRVRVLMRAQALITYKPL